MLLKHAAAVLLAFAACAGTPHDDAPSMVKGISEEEFKTMHELRTDGTPPLLGTMLEVGGDHAYLSLPAAKRAPMPAVLVIHEWYGLNDHIKHCADRLAAEGYAALAVDLYGGNVAKDSTEASQLMRGVDGQKARATLQSMHAFLVSDSRVKATKTGVIGWCFGGLWSLQAGLVIPELDAVVMYYGRPVDDPLKLAPLRAPLLGVFGNKDRSITPQNVDAFEAALTKAGKQHTILRYDAEHAFANPSNKIYDAKSAADAWGHVRAFFAKHLD